MSNDDPLKEKTRTCPSCRSEISVLATKCLHCGETVGKPKAEVRQLSVEDLGGEVKKAQPTPASVVGAMDSMRQDSGSGKTFDSLPKIDLDNLGMDDSANTGTAPPAQSQSQPQSAAPQQSDGGIKMKPILKILVSHSF